MGLGSGIRDLGSRKNLFRIPDPGPGVKKALDPGFGSATLHSCLIFDMWFRCSYTVTRPYPERMAPDQTVREREHFFSLHAGILHSSVPEDISGTLRNLPSEKRRSASREGLNSRP